MNRIPTLAATAATAAIAATALTACGGGESEEDRVRATVDTLFTAGASGDGPTACEQLTAKLLQANGGATGCAKDVLETSDELTEAQRAAFGRVGIRHVTLRKDVARIDARDFEVPAVLEAAGWRFNTLTLRREDGRWKIDETS